MSMEEGGCSVKRKREVKKEEEQTTQEDAIVAKPKKARSTLEQTNGPTLRQRIEQLKSDFEIFLKRTLPKDKPKAEEYLNLVTLMSVEDMMVQVSERMKPFVKWGLPSIPVGYIMNLCDIKRVDITEEEYGTFLYFVRQFSELSKLLE
jgi:hypothetical protein